MKLQISFKQNTLPYEDYILMRPKNPFQLETEGIDNGELDSLYTDAVFSAVKFDQLPQSVASLVSKVKLGGTIIVREFDFKVLVHDYKDFLVSLTEMNAILAGRTLIESAYMKTLLESQNIKIYRQQIIDKEFILHGIRNA